MNLKRIAFGGVMALGLMTSGAYAATSVGFVSPPNGSTYAVGTAVTVTGQAGASGGSGTGLDLALVLDGSGSMGGARLAAQAAAAKALVDALPTVGVSVSVVSFDGSTPSDLRIPLTSTSSATNVTAIKAAIDAVPASGGTDIQNGITRAAGELTGANHIAGRVQQMVVISDGGQSISPIYAASNAAVAAGVDAIHSVGIPGHTPSTMQAVVAGMNQTYEGTVNVSAGGDDYGVYTNASDLNALINLFNGTAGNLVGLDFINLTLPDGTVINNYATDGLGNFSVNWNIQAGANTFTVFAQGTDGTTATASWTLFGGTGPAQVPVPAPLALMGLAMLAMRRLRKSA